MRIARRPHFAKQLALTLCLLVVAIGIGRVWADAANVAIVAALIASALLPVLWPSKQVSKPDQAENAVEIPAILSGAHQPRYFRRSRPGILVLGIEDIADEQFIKAAQALQDVTIIDPRREGQLPLIDAPGSTQSVFPRREQEELQGSVEERDD